MHRKLPISTLQVYLRKYLFISQSLLGPFCTWYWVRVLLCNFVQLDKITANIIILYFTFFYKHIDSRGTPRLLLDQIISVSAISVAWCLHIPGNEMGWGGQELLQGKHLQFLF